MADTKAKTESESAPATNYQDQPANQETSVRDAKHPDEKPDPSTVAQVEEIKD